MGYIKIRRPALLARAPRTEQGLLPVSFTWDPSTADTVFFVADRAYRIENIRARVEVAGTDAGAVTAIVKKAASGTAITAGTAVHTGSINLKGTAATNQALTNAAEAARTLAAGDAVGFDLTGVMTAAVGTVTLLLSPRN